MKKEAPLPYTVSFKPRSRAEYLASDEGQIKKKMFLDSFYDAFTSSQKYSTGEVTSCP